MAKKKEILSPKERLQVALVPDWEQPYKVPENWCWTRIAKLCSLSNGKAFKPTDWTKTGIPIVRIQNLNNPEAQYNLYSGAVEDKFRLCGGELLFAWSGTPGTSFGAHIWWGKEAVLNQHIFRVDFDEKYINKIYFKYAINQQLDMLISVAHGGAGLQHVTKGVFEATPIPLPPFAEQQRIVDRIESLFAKLDEAKQKAQDALDSFETRKAAILHRAFTGELTAQWRKEHGVGMKSWENLRLENLIEGGPQNGLYKPQTAYGTGTKILRIDCFYEGAVLPWENLKRLALSKNEIEQYHLNINDIVINRVNSMAYLGKSALIRELPEECVFESNMMRITLNTRMVIPEYAIKYLNSVIGVQELRKNAKQAVNQASINQQDVKNVAIKLPKLDEQAEIVRILDDLLAKEQQAKEAAEGVLEQIDLIKKAILARAFRGELGTNDPSEESAVELVKRVLAVEPPPKARAKAVSIPREVEEQLKCELERKIMKLYYYSDSQSLPINTLMEVSSKKFEVLESIRNLEQRGIIKKLPNGNYKLVR